MEEKERLLKLEDFKKEKSGKMAGVKWKRSPTQSITRMKTKAQKTKPNVYSLPLVTFQSHTQSDQLSGKEINTEMLEIGLEDKNLSDGWNDKKSDGGTGDHANFDRDADNL